MDVGLIQSQWAHIRVGLLTTLDLFRDEELDFLAFPGGRTVRQIALHIGQEELGEFAYGITQELDHFPSDFSDADFPDHQSIKDHLESIHHKTVDYLQKQTEEESALKIQTPWGAEYPLIEMVLHLTEHEIHHRGELLLLLGTLGRGSFDAWSVSPADITIIV